jgi:hypothetical protein
VRRAASCLQPIIPAADSPREKRHVASRLLASHSGSLGYEEVSRNCDPCIEPRSGQLRLSSGRRRRRGRRRRTWTRSGLVRNGGAIGHDARFGHNTWHARHATWIGYARRTRNTRNSWHTRGARHARRPRDTRHARDARHTGYAWCTCHAAGVRHTACLARHAAWFGNESRIYWGNTAALIDSNRPPRVARGCIDSMCHETRCAVS